MRAYVCLSFVSLSHCPYVPIIWPSEHGTQTHTHAHTPATLNTHAHLLPLKNKTHTHLLFLIYDTPQQTNTHIEQAGHACNLQGKYTKWKSHACDRGIAEQS